MEKIMQEDPSTVKRSKRFSSGNREHHMIMLRTYIKALEAGATKQTEIRAFAKANLGGGVSPRSLTRVRRVLAFWGVNEKNTIPVLNKVLESGYTLYEIDRMAFSLIHEAHKEAFAKVLNEKFEKKN